MRSRGGRPCGTRGLGSRGPSAGAGRPGAARGGREQGPAPSRGREARQRRGPRGLLSLSPCRGAANAAATAWRVTPGSPPPQPAWASLQPLCLPGRGGALALRGRGGVGPLPSPRERPASLGAGTRSSSNVPWAGGRGAWPGEGPWPGRRPSPPGRRARPRAALPHCSEGAWGWGCLCGHGACASEAAC